MSDPDGQLPVLLPGESRRMHSSTSREFADLLPDTSRYFEVWLENLKPKPGPTSHPRRLTLAEQTAPSEFRFEGILRVNGYAAGFLHSVTGTLIIDESGEAECDVIVATAIIKGCVRGNIHATERVELGSHARVFGNIESPVLSIQSGAIFEGECHFLRSPNKITGEDDGQMPIPSTHDYPGINQEAGEEEGQALAVAAGR